MQIAVAERETKITLACSWRNWLLLFSVCNSSLSNLSSICGGSNEIHAKGHHKFRIFLASVSYHLHVFNGFINTNVMVTSSPQLAKLITLCRNYFKGKEKVNVAVLHPFLHL